MFYVRWRRGEPRRGRVFDALTIDHSGYALPCVECDESLGDGHSVQLIAVGPDDEKSAEKFAAGRWCTIAAVPLHAACADALTDGGLELLISELVPVSTVETLPPVRLHTSPPPIS